MFNEQLYRSTFHILEKLVGFDTTSNRTNLELINYVKCYLAEHGIEAELIHNEENNKANLIARIGPDAPGGILFSGHTDIIAPGNPELWDTDPLKLTTVGDQLFGRGTSDMKGFIACVLAQVPAWSATQLTKPAHLVFSYDEEIGCLGVISALKVLKDRGVSPDLCVVGEPTGHQIACTHNSRTDVFGTFTATGGHPARANDPEHTNALTTAAGFVWNVELQHQSIGELLGDPKGLLGPATITPTKGIVTTNPNDRNVAPNHAETQHDLRADANMTAERVLKVFRFIANATVSNLGKFRTGSATAELRAIVTNPGFKCDSPTAEALALELFGVRGPGERAIGVSYVCEAAMLAQYGFGNTVVCGPGDINRAHKPKEWVGASELDRFNASLARVLPFLQQKFG